MDEEKYTDLITKRFAGELSPGEDESLTRWIETSEKNRRIYASLQKSWDLTASRKQFALPDIDEEWEKLESRLGLAGDRQKATIRQLHPAPARESSRRRTPGWMRYALAAMLAFTVIGLANYLGFWSFDNATYIATQNAETHKVTLPDGSVVYLNNASEIAYAPLLEGAERTVKLRGEAYFDVEKGERPFVVVTENARVRVLGTEFNVWARNAQTRVIVREGQVALSDRDGNSENRALLTANHQGVAQSGESSIDVLEVDAAQVIGWRDERVYFNAAPLREVIAELERIYDVRIQYSAEELGNQETSLNLNRRTIESTLETLSVYLKASFRFDGEKFILERQ